MKYPFLCILSPCAESDLISMPVYQHYLSITFSVRSTKQCETYRQEFQTSIIGFLNLHPLSTIMDRTQHFRHWMFPSSGEKVGRQSGMLERA